MNIARLLTATPLLLAALMVAAMFMGQAVGTTALPAPDQGTAAEAMAIRPPAEGSVAALLADCEDPEGALPSSVVVTPEGAAAPVVGGEVLVGQALEQVFDGVDYGLTVHGFCK